MRHILFAILLVSAGCGHLARLNSVKMRAGTNPRYRSMPETTEVLVAPLLDCSSSRADVAPAEELHEWLGDKLFPEVWRRLGVGKPVRVHAPSSKTCKYLYESDKEIGQNADPSLQAIATKLLDGQPQDNVFLILYSRRYYCENETRAVRDAEGRPLGSIETGKQNCYENGQFDVAGYMFNRQGDLMYSTGGRVEYAAFWEDKDIDRVTSKLLDKLPRTAFVGKEWSSVAKGSDEGTRRD